MILNTYDREKYFITIKPNNKFIEKKAKSCVGVLSLKGGLLSNLFLVCFQGMFYNTCNEPYRQALAVIKMYRGFGCFETFKFFPEMFHYRGLYEQAVMVTECREPAEHSVSPVSRHTVTDAFISAGSIFQNDAAQYNEMLLCFLGLSGKVIVYGKHFVFRRSQAL